MILPSSSSRFWVMFVENEWHARGRTSRPLFAAKSGGQEVGELGARNARAQLIAEAVAAFKENNAHREAAGLPPMAEKVMPGTVTQTLSTHIRYGTYPPEEICVTYCYPPVPRPAHRHSEGMKPLDNRREILKCYEAFKVIVGI